MDYNGMNKKYRRLLDARQDDKEIIRSTKARQVMLSDGTVYTVVVLLGYWVRSSSRRHEKDLDAGFNSKNNGLRRRVRRLVA